MKRTCRGFTLMELMIVIAIIAVLAAVLISNLLHARAEAQTYSCEANLRQLATAMEEYAVDHTGLYPASVAILKASGNYLANVPVDPSGGNYVITNAAVAPCVAIGGGPTFTITDGDLHDGSTGTNVTGYVAGNKGIDYCAGSGLLSVP